MIKTTLHLEREYAPADNSDGVYGYIDRLWPRGLSHETFHYDLWDKDIAPSTELREWFHADPETRWTEFEKRYGTELRTSAAFADLVQTLASHTKATLLYSSHDHQRNNAVIVLNTLLSSYPERFRI